MTAHVDIPRTRLRQLVLMLSSDKPGEIVAAANAIGRALAACGMDWHAFAERLIERPAAIAPARDDGDEDWRDVHAYCQQHAHQLRPREQKFLDSLEDWCGELTDRQSDWLHGLHNRLRRHDRR